MSGKSNFCRPGVWLTPPFRALVESVNAAVFIIKGHKYLYANPLAESWTGYSVAELQSMDFWEIVHPDEQETVRNRGLGRQAGAQVPDKYLIRIIHKDGKVVHTSYTASLINLDGEPAILGVSQDITEQEIFRLQKEDQLRQAQKMEAIGTLVSGLAHDFNNILAGVTGNVYLARILAGDAGKAREKLEKIDQLSMRAAGMIRQLLAFARKDMVNMKPFAVQAFVADIMARERLETAAHIKIEVDSGPDKGLQVKGDCAQLQQVLIHLVENARAALEGVKKPEISLSLTPFVADDSFALSHPGISGRKFVRITLSDNGCGMGAATMARIFEPFFSTKGVGGGSGLGLSMAYGAIQMHGGAIEVESSEGEGSTFRVYLPLYFPTTEQRILQAPDGLVPGNGECILYVDDDAGVLSTGSDVLRSLGYRVREASDGGMAVEVFRQHADEIDLVLLDVVMPVLDGRQAAEAMRALRPDVRLIFATGYDKTEALFRLENASAGDVLLKPYSVEGLSQAIRRRLDN